MIFRHVLHDFIFKIFWNSDGRTNYVFSAILEPVFSYD